MNRVLAKSVAMLLLCVLFVAPVLAQGVGSTGSPSSLEAEVAQLKETVKLLEARLIMVEARLKSLEVAAPDGGAPTAGGPSATPPSTSNLELLMTIGEIRRGEPVTQEEENLYANLGEDLKGKQARVAEIRAELDDMMTKNRVYADGYQSKGNRRTPPFSEGQIRAARQRADDADKEAAKVKRKMDDIDKKRKIDMFLVLATDEGGANINVECIGPSAKFMSRKRAGQKIRVIGKTRGTDPITRRETIEAITITEP